MPGTARGLWDRQERIDEFVQNGQPFEQTQSALSIRIWMVICWCFLTLGILLGSWWAYHELGWGGWWFWDPVENASLMPWLLATACIHSVLIPRLQFWTLLLALMTFTLSILGTFFVRSGLLASVHSFATDSTRGFYLLWFVFTVFVVSIGALTRWHYASHLRTAPGSARVLPQEQTILFQNACFCILCLLVLCGTVAPIVFQLCFHRDVSTGPAFFHGTTIPLFSSMLFGMIYAHFTKLRFTSDALDNKAKARAPQKEPSDSTKWWKMLNALHQELWPLRTVHDASRVVSYTPNRLAIDFIVVTVSHTLFFYFFTHLACLESILTTVCFLLFCSVLLFQIQSFSQSAQTALDGHPKLLTSRLVAITSKVKTIALSMRLSHTGVILLILGIIMSHRNKIQLTSIMHLGEVVQLNDHCYSLRSIDQNYGPTYHSICGNIGVYLRTAAAKDKHFANDILQVSAAPQSDFNSVYEQFPIAYQNQTPADHFHLQLCMFPEKRFLLSNQQLTTTKVAIHTNLLTDLYAFIGMGNIQAGWYTTIIQLPWIGLIWLGFVVAAWGGLRSLVVMVSTQRLHWL